MSTPLAHAAPRGAATPWTRATVPEAWIWPGHSAPARQSTVALEADVAVRDIMNRSEVRGCRAWFVWCRSRESVRGGSRACVAGWDRGIGGAVSGWQLGGYLGLRGPPAAMA